MRNTVCRILERVLWLRIESGRDIPSYFALRICPRAEAPRWWAAARAAAATAPPAIRSILGGRTRVEVSAGEAADALEWAQAIDGWDPDRLPPVVVYPVDPR